MKVRLLAVGKAPRWIDEGVAEYARRLPADTRFGVDVVRPRRGQSDEDRLLAEVRPREIKVIFDRQGRVTSSEDFAGLVGEWHGMGRDVALLVGGVAGFSKVGLAAADHVLSLSAMTFPHLMVRVLVAEQVYRARSILGNHPYHLAHAGSG